MTTLGELARLIRSKNAGPFMLTFDVMFDEEATYRRVVASGVLNKAMVGALYGIDPAEILLFEHDAARAIKISIARPYPQCSLEDGDAYGGQQHAPLVDLVIPAAVATPDRPS